MRSIAPLPSIRLTPTNIGRLVDEVCAQGTPTNLIACCSRSYFLKQLVEYTRPDATTTHEASEDLPSQESPSPDIETEDDPTSLRPKPSLLVHPTLKLIAVSSKVKLAFCPTIPTFRAYLSTLPIHAAAEDIQLSRVIIMNVLALHRDTSEFTLQGLSRSFSLIASVNQSLRGGVELLECTDVDDRLSPVDGPLPWDVEVPLLSGSIKIGEAGQGWAARKISVKNFADRWFNFE